MVERVVSCFIVMILVTLVQGDKHEELLASSYEYIEGVGYYAFGTSKNWSFAQTDCMTTKARLAVIDSQEELQAIVSFSSNNTQDTYVYGGYTNDHESQYVTTDGIPMKQSDYTKWEAEKPSGSSYRCVGINTKTGELTDFPCNNTMSYVCEHQLWTEYHYVEELGYYKLHTEGKAWAEAYAICESEGAHLLVINAQEEADAVIQIFNEHPSLPNTDYNDWVYIGFRGVFEYLSNRTYQGTYLTIFGTPVSDLGYVNWLNAAQPYNGYDSNCGVLGRSGRLATDICNRNMAFFCEKTFEVFSRT